MKLGMISYTPLELTNLDTLKKISDRGLSFVELCINIGINPKSLEDKVDLFKQAKSEINLDVGSIGRWGSHRIKEDGTISQEEFDNDRKLIDIAGTLKSPVFNIGCNYVSEISEYANLNIAMEYFGKIIDYAKDTDIKISIYNCDWENYIYNEEKWKYVLNYYKSLYIKYDPSHSFYRKENYLKEIADWGHRFSHFHIKGGVLVDGNRVDDPPAGMDQIDWNSVFALLHKNNYEGGLSIEPHSATWWGERGEWGIDFTIDFVKKFLITK